MTDYRIVQIFDDDHGCEGIMPDEKPMVMVLLEDDNDNRLWARIPEQWLMENSFDEGDRLSSEAVEGYIIQ